MKRQEQTSTPRGVPRRALVRTMAWGAPVVLSVAAAPAMAASVGPLTVTAYKTLITQQLVLSFSRGQTGLPVTIVSVSTNSGRSTISMAPASVSSTNGVSYGTLLSTFLLLTYSYTVVYIFNGQTYTTVVAA